MQRKRQTRGKETAYPSETRWNHSRATPPASTPGSPRNSKRKRCRMQSDRTLSIAAMLSSRRLFLRTCRQRHTGRDTLHTQENKSKQKQEQGQETSRIKYAGSERQELRPIKKKENGRKKEKTRQGLIIGVSNTSLTEPLDIS